MAYKVTIYDGKKFVKSFVKQTKEEAETSVKVCKIMTQLDGAENFHAKYEEIPEE